ncbi:hypothetical protein ID866_5301 [Astraeus odoratus]|nr:hypothetical protein ID866_5301 [Astraeus odoratus]
MAADPHTVEAYVERTTLPCAPLSFMEIAEAALPPIITSFTSLHRPKETEEASSALVDNSGNTFSLMKADMVVCSFALHLVESPSELFALLWELSTKARWLVVLAPHKKPEVRVLFLIYG